MKKKFEGLVVSDKMEKGCVVKVMRLWQHPLYKKRLKRSKKFLVHDEIGVKEGDQVIIEECRPRSKKKRWQVVKKI